jgi:hypothetical protein
MIASLSADEGSQLLTLSEVAPIWADRLQQNKKLPFPLSLTWLKWYFELDHPSKCVVGEAYQYTKSYQSRCKECDRLGWQFGDAFLRCSRVKLQRNINIFLKHWNEKHMYLQ